ETFRHQDRLFVAVNGEEPHASQLKSSKTSTYHSSFRTDEERVKNRTLHDRRLDEYAEQAVKLALSPENVFAQLRPELQANNREPLLSGSRTSASMTRAGLPKESRF